MGSPMNLDSPPTHLAVTFRHCSRLHRVVTAIYIKGSPMNLDAIANQNRKYEQNWILELSRHHHHQWPLRKCLGIRNFPSFFFFLMNGFEIFHLLNWVFHLGSLDLCILFKISKIVYLTFLGCTGAWKSIFPHHWMPLPTHLLSLMELRGQSALLIVFFFCCCMFLFLSIHCPYSCLFGIYIVFTPCAKKSTWTLFCLFVFFEGCTSLTHAHLHSVCGLPGIIRLFSSPCALCFHFLNCL